jgi:spore maturation protein CgeD
MPLPIKGSRNMGHKISVILTSYNKPKSVGDAIKSVLNQTYPNWELFIMDDHSKEETVNLIKGFLNDNRIQYDNSQIQDDKRHETTRYATLINEAIPKTSGKYLSYLTDDNLYLPDRFKKMVDILRANSHIEIVYSQQLVKWLDHDDRLENEMVRLTKGILSDIGESIDHCSVMHSRKIAEQVFEKYGNYWDNHPNFWYNGDAAFWQRLVKFSPFYPIPETLDIAIKKPDCYQRLATYLPQIIPDGTLIKGPSTDIYFIEKQKRRKILPAFFYKLKYDYRKIVNVPDPVVYRFLAGADIDDQIFTNLLLMPSQKLVKSNENTNLYFIQNSIKHSITERCLTDYKFDRTQIIQVKQHLLDELPEGLPIKRIDQDISILPDGRLFSINKDHYLAVNNELHSIENLVAAKLSLPIDNPIIVGKFILEKFNEGKPIKWVKFQGKREK